jgi:hypothetical protein
VTTLMIVARFAAGDTQAAARAEYVAGEERATGVPAKVVYDLATDDFRTVIPLADSE